MYQDFRITTIDTDIRNKTITITANLDIDSKLVNEATVNIFHKASRNYLGYSSTVTGRQIVLVLNDWPEPNVEYIIVVQKLKTVLQEELASGIRRKLIFESSIRSKLKLKHPQFDEVVTAFELEVEEVLADEQDQYVKSFYIELSSDSAFHDVIKTYEFEQNKIHLSHLQNGQYFIRGRVQLGIQYGLWSEVSTFVFGNEQLDPGPIFDDGSDDDDIFTPEIKIMSTSQNGETPSFLLIEFDSDIDVDSIDGIVLVRRDM